MRVIVTGGRRINGRAAERLRASLDQLFAQFGRDLVIVHGGCRTGADNVADMWARGRCRTEVFMADWDAHGRAAGPIRNREMAQAGANLCLFTAGGRGTESMKREAARARIAMHDTGGQPWTSIELWGSGIAIRYGEARRT